MKKKIINCLMLMVVGIMFLVFAVGSTDSTTTNNSNSTNKTINGKVVFLKNSNGKEFYSILCEVGQIDKNRIPPVESEDSIDYANSNSNYAVSMCTSKNHEICYISMMAYNQDYENFFLAASRLEYDGSNRSKAFNWIHDNLGKEATTKIGDANFKLYIGATNKPILEIYTDGNDEFQQQLLNKLTNNQ